MLVPQMQSSSWQRSFKTTLNKTIEQPVSNNDQAGAPTTSFTVYKNRKKYVHSLALRKCTLPIVFRPTAAKFFPLTTCGGERILPVHVQSTAKCSENLTT